jgi:hypothetical protein
MSETTIGRVLVASLHQGIADILPTRLPFYETWLTPARLRDQRLGLGPLQAVLSFLRLEGQVSYGLVMKRAGRYAGEWVYDEIPGAERAIVARCSPPLRAWWAVHASRRLFRQTFRGSVPHVRLNGGTATLRINASIFCTVREPAAWPLCGFYAAAVERYIERFGIDAVADVRDCRSSGADVCTMDVVILGARDQRPVMEAA